MPECHEVVYRTGPDTLTGQARAQQFPIRSTRTVSANSLKAASE